MGFKLQRWIKWRSTSSVIYDIKYRSSVGKFYHIDIRHVLLYGTGCLTVKSNKRINLI